MNLKSQALGLQTFLSQYTQLWSEEIMNEYPRTIKAYPKEWIELLDGLTESELFAIDGKFIIDKIQGSTFAKFMEQANSLSTVDFQKNCQEIPLEDWAYNGVKKKKRHEIQKIAPVISELKKNNQIDSVVDIGGGVGHLSRVLAHYHSIPTISLDRNLEFQKIGKERLKKYRRIENAAEVEFVSLNFGSDIDNHDLLAQIFKPNSFGLGLHTCGPLANTLINQTIEFKTAGLLNFGCCYHSLDPKNDFPLSQFYKSNNPLHLSLYSLTLATRSHGQMTISDYQTKERVKYYRYALHLFLVQYFQKKDFIEVGECNTRIYWGAFSDYISMKLKELNIEHQFSELEFNQFFDLAETKMKLREMWLCNLIRWQLGRTLEVYLLIDRCLYLEEQGFNVSIAQYFKEALSPRNIGILALIKK